MSYVLGLWHPGKHLMEIIWRRYAAILWAPYVHFLTPQAKFTDKPKTLRLHCYLQYVRVSYPQVRAVLESAIADVAAQFPIYEVSHRWLLNIKDLFEIYLPLVLFVCVCDCGCVGKGVYFVTLDC
jgi:hypothetical protein